MGVGVYMCVSVYFVMHYDYYFFFSQICWYNFRLVVSLSVYYTFIFSILFFSLLFLIEFLSPLPFESSSSYSFLSFFVFTILISPVFPLPLYILSSSSTSPAYHLHLLFLIFLFFVPTFLLSLFPCRLIFFRPFSIILTFFLLLSGSPFLHIFFLPFFSEMLLTEDDYLFNFRIKIE